MSERTIKSQVLWPEAAKQSGDIKPWLSGILGAARKQRCHKAIPPMRHCEKIIREPLDKAAEVVANAVASDAGGSAKVKAVAIPEGQITAASIDEQYELADLVRTWTDKKKDWRMFTAIDDDEEEIGTKMLLMVLRKYMAIGSAPVTDWKAEFNRKQGEDETAMGCWERIKTAATALASADRAMPHALIVDTLKEALSSSHTHWVVDIEDDATFEQIDALIIKKGVYIDQKERGCDSAGKAAYVAADAANESDKDEQIRVLTAAVSSLQSTMMKKNLSAASSSSKKFTGNCHYCLVTCLLIVRSSRQSAAMILRPASVGRIRTRMISREPLSLRASLLTTLTLHLPPPTTLLRVKRGNLCARKPLSVISLRIKVFALAVMWLCPCRIRLISFAIPMTRAMMLVISLLLPLLWRVCILLRSTLHLLALARMR